MLALTILIYTVIYCSAAAYVSATLTPGEVSTCLQYRVKRVKRVNLERDLATLLLARN